MINEFKGIGYERNGSEYLRPQKTPLAPPASRAESEARTLTATGDRVQLSQEGLEASRQGVEAVRRVERLSATEVVDNVASFVESRIRREAEKGASAEELSSLLKQAREGLAAGYDDAIGIIRDQGLLTEELEAEIEVGRQGILERFDQLEESVLNPRPEAAQPDRATRGSREVEADQPVRERPQAEAPARVERESSQPLRNFSESAFSARQDQISIELRTRDGDVVTLNSASLQALAGGQQGNGQSLQSYNARYSESGYGFSVEGSLDEGELKAIESFVFQVRELADSFFEGDFEAAFNSALELQADPSEIAQFAVSLSTTRVQGYQASGASENASRYSPLVDQVGRVKNALRSAEPFENRPQVLEQLVRTFAEQKQKASEQIQAYLDFTRELAERLEKQLFGQA